MKQSDIWVYGYVYKNKLLRGQKWNKLCPMFCSSGTNNKCNPMSLINLIVYLNSSKHIIPLLFCNNIKGNENIATMEKGCIITANVEKIDINKEDSLFLVREFSIVFNPNIDFCRN